MGLGNQTHMTCQTLETQHLSQFQSIGTTQQFGILFLPSMTNLEPYPLPLSVS